MIVIAVLFLLGTSVSAGPFIPHGHVQNVIRGHKTPDYFPLVINEVRKPQILRLSTILPTELQPLIAAIEKDDCQKSLPIVSPLLVEEFIKEPVKLEPVLKIRTASIVAAPYSTLDIKDLVIPKPPQLPKLYVDITKQSNIKRTEYEEPQKPSTPVIIPPAPVLPPMELPELPIIVKKIQLTPDEPCENLPGGIKKPAVIPTAPVLPFLELTKLPVTVEEPTIAPHLILPEIVEYKPSFIPEPPKLPELYDEDLEKLKGKIPEYDIGNPSVSSVVPSAPQLPPMELPVPVGIEKIRITPELPCEHFSPETKFPVLVEEIPDIRPLIISEPPTLPELSVQDLEQLKNNVPEYPTEELEKPSISVAPPSAPQLPPMELVVSPKLPELFVENLEQLIDNVPEYEIVAKLPESPSNLAVIPPAPQLPPMEVPKLPMRIEEVRITPELPCEHFSPETKFPVLVEEIPDIRPLIISEPPTLPELSFQDLEQLKNNILEYPKEEPEKPLISVALPSAPQLPPMELAVPPKFSELFIENLEQLKGNAPEYEVVAQLPENPSNLAVIPPAPQLPPMEVPQLPVRVEEIKITPELPCEPFSPESKFPILVEETPDIRPLIISEPPILSELSFPPAPQLPPMELSELPAKVESIKIISGTAPEYEIEVKEPKNPSNLAVILPAPQLSPIELPKFPLFVEKQHLVPELPCENPAYPIKVEIEVPQPEEPKKPVIPPAPLLPPIELPELPSIVLAPETPCEQSKPISSVQKEVTEIKEVIKPIVLPPAPVLPSIELPEFLAPNLPELSFEYLEKSDLPTNLLSTPILISEENAMLHPYFYKNKKCVEDIVLQRILPEIGKNLKKNLRVFEDPHPYVGPIGFKLHES